MFLKQMEIVHDVDKMRVDVQKVLMERKTVKKWAYIIHDKDDTRPHYHIYLNFGNSSINTADVAKWFELGYVDEDGNNKTGEQFIEKVKGRYTDIGAFQRMICPLFVILLRNIKNPQIENRNCGMRKNANGMNIKKERSELRRRNIKCITHRAMSTSYSMSIA